MKTKLFPTHGFGLQIFDQIRRICFKEKIGCLCQFESFAVWQRKKGPKNRNVNKTTFVQVQNNMSSCFIHALGGALWMARSFCQMIHQLGPHWNISAITGWTHKGVKFLVVEEWIVISYLVIFRLFLIIVILRWGSYLWFRDWDQCLFQYIVK